MLAVTCKRATPDDSESGIRAVRCQWQKVRRAWGARGLDNPGGKKTDPHDLRPRASTTRPQVAVLHTLGDTITD